jgi:hypothetical protein
VSAGMDLQEYRLENEKRWADFSVRLKAIEDDNEVIYQRLNKQSALVQDIQQLSSSVAVLANNMKSMLDEQQRQNKRLEELEKKPVKRWDAVIDKIVMTVLGALIAFVLLQVGLTPS